MAAISPDSQSRLAASLRQIWGCRSGHIACLVSLTGVRGTTLRPPACSGYIPERIRGGVICFTEIRSALAYTVAMSKESQTSFDVHDDLRTDYALIATGVGAALIALIYLLLV